MTSMKKNVLRCLMLLIAASTLALQSCDNDDNDYSVAPYTLESVTITPNPCSPEGQLTATVKLKDTGKYCYMYKMTYKYGDVSQSTQDFSTDSLGNYTFSFTAPKNEGTYNISVSATVGFVAGSTLYGATNSVNTTFEVWDE